ncbi:MAG: radical SAM protein [Candidatus Hermodarchaeota archaeon]
MINHRVGIITGHNELLSLENTDFSLFFKFLGTQGRIIESINKLLDSRLLEIYDTLLIGVPRSELPASECLALQKWITRGGHLLLLSSFGGDVAPNGEESRSTNLNSILGGVEFPDFLLGMDSNVVSENDSDKISIKGRRSYFLPKVFVDISTLVREPATLCYDTGTIIKLLSESWKITHSLPFPDEDTYVVHRARLDGNCVVGGEKISEGYCYEDGFLFLRALYGKGVICVLGSAWFLKNTALSHKGNILFLNELIRLWYPRLIQEELHRRRGTPQRHRLLHAYPTSRMMFPIRKENLPHYEDLEDIISLDYLRPQIIGVLPHPFCNPRIRGCGFCTFPHEPYNITRANTVVDNVIQEITNFSNQYQELCHRSVSGVYFGGGTANLTPPTAFRKLCQNLVTKFDLRQAEITLEGVPAYFLRKPSFLEILQEEIPARHFRISMGIQTFDPKQIKRMGRENFGNRETIAEVIHFAQSQGISVSGDLLFNLPGQTLNQMQEDIHIALEMGFKQLCLYHLVMFEKLGTVWAQDPELLKKIPNNTVACENWLALRETMLNAGFVQNSLTNFTHQGVHKTDHRYIYEELGFQPDKHDVLGFGSSGICYFSNFREKQALKLQSHTQSTSYIQAIQERGRGWTKSFLYDLRDLKIFYLTRGIASLGIDISAYKSYFGTSPQEDFPTEFQALRNAQLLNFENGKILLTPTGMFYADTIAGLLAWRQVHRYRLNQMCETFSGQTDTTVYALNVDIADVDPMG